MKEENIMSDVLEIVRKSEQAEDTVYTGKGGKTYTEKAGTYDPALTEAVSRDIFSRAMIDKTLDETSKETLVNACTLFHENNLALMRRMDDFKAHRELIDYDYEKTAAFVKDFAEKYTQESDDLIKTMLRRLLVMNNWVFYMEQKDAIRKELFEAGIREYDHDGNFIGNVDDADEEIIKTLCRIRSIFLKALIRTDVFSDDHQLLLNRIESLEIIIRSILDGNFDELFDETVS